LQVQMPAWPARTRMRLRQPVQSRALLELMPVLMPVLMRELMPVLMRELMPVLMRELMPMPGLNLPGWPLAPRPSLRLVPQARWQAQVQALGPA